MNDFNKFNSKLQEQFKHICSLGDLFRLELPEYNDEILGQVSTGMQLVDTYLKSFKPEDNPIFRVNTVHDCNNDKNS
jgi:hypothetical protein